jgi:hypothetical protein
MDLSKVNPILGYEMYSQRDKALMNARGAKNQDDLSRQVESLTKSH